jgi:hypothetical protein
LSARARVFDALLVILLLICIARLVRASDGSRKSAAGLSSIRT